MIFYSKQWDFLNKNFESESLAHAFLFSGKDVNLVEKFTKEFTKLINCLSDKKPCSKCQNCKMIEGGIFTDLMVIKSSDSPSSKKNEKDMMEISIEQVRDSQNFLSFKSYYGNFKAVVVNNADRMTKDAQSCFLKTLEEPKGKTVIVLITSNPDLLLPTINSRCQQIKFSNDLKSVMSIEDQKILQDLSRVINLDLAEKFNYAKNINLEEGNFNKILSMLQSYFRNELLSKLGIGEYSQKSYSIEKLKKIIKLIDKINHQSNTYNINQKLALEIILIES